MPSFIAEVTADSVHLPCLRCWANARLSSDKRATEPVAPQASSAEPKP